MFRAILWKEWRELWMLVFVVLVFGGFGVLLDQWWGEDMPMFGWPILFISLVIISVLIPHQLFSTEWEKRTSLFILSKPMDRFRLWWLKMIAGALFLGAMGILAGALAVGAKALFPREAMFDPRHEEMIRSLTASSLHIFALCSFAFAAMKSNGFILIVVLSFVLFNINRMTNATIDWSMAEEFASVSAPLLMFLSLVAFARGDFRRRTKRTIIFGYSASALLLLGLLMLGRLL